MMNLIYSSFYYIFQHACVVNLLSGLQSQCQQTVQVVCLTIIEAVYHGLISGDVIITYLVSACASMAHWANGVNALSQILTKKVQASLSSHGSFTCSYSLRYDTCIHI